MVSLSQPLSLKSTTHASCRDKYTWCCPTVIWTAPVLLPWNHSPHFLHPAPLPPHTHILLLHDIRVLCIQERGNEAMRCSCCTPLPCLNAPQPLQLDTSTGHALLDNRRHPFPPSPTRPNPLCEAACQSVARSWPTSNTHGPATLTRTTLPLSSPTTPYHCPNSPLLSSRSADTVAGWKPTNRPFLVKNTLPLR